MIIGILNNGNTLAYEMLKKAVSSFKINKIQFMDSDEHFNYLYSLNRISNNVIAVVNITSIHNTELFDKLIDINHINNYSGTLQELKGKVIEEFLYTSGIFPGINTREIFSVFYMPPLPYHNKNHIRNVLMDYLLFLYATDVKESDSAMYYAIMYHDFIYDPRKSDNEVQSAKAFRDIAVEEGKLSSELINEIEKLIISTKDLDNHPFLEHDISVYRGLNEEIIEAAKAITLEYGHLNFDKFRNGNIAILNKLKSLTGMHTVEGINIQINFLKHWKPNVGIFCGSFKPFHYGHASILSKAEKIFDKVIVVQAQNPSKDVNDSHNIFNIEYLNNVERHIVTTIPELVFQLLFTYNVTLIRGIRNPNDAQDSMSWEYYLNELGCYVPVINIVSEIRYSKLSASGIREVEQLYPYKKPFHRPI